MRKSKHVSVLFLSLLVTGCDGDASQREFYATKEACLTEWNNNPSYCEEGTHSTHGHGYYSPLYSYYNGGYHLEDGALINRSSSGRSMATAPSSSFRSSTNSTVSRGGFGSTGRSFGGGASA